MPALARMYSNQPKNTNYCVVIKRCVVCQHTKTQFNVIFSPFHWTVLRVQCAHIACLICDVTCPLLKLCLFVFSSIPFGLHLRNIVFWLVWLLILSAISHNLNLCGFLCTVFIDINVSRFIFNWCIIIFSIQNILIDFDKLNVTRRTNKMIMNGQKS